MMALTRSPVRSIGSFLPAFITGPALSSLPIAHRFSTATSLRAQKLTKRAVVGSFLLKRDPKDGRPKVALFRRTDKVNTYRGKFATISGGIEPSDASPLDAARRELFEETTLEVTSAGLRLLAAGKHFSFVDRVVHYEWFVHPFAFRLDAPDTDIRLGWEHEAAFRWFEPDGLPAPEELAAGIVESLRRVWPEGALGHVEPLCRYILREDDESLAVTGTDRAFLVFNSAAAERLSNDRDEWWRLVRLAAWHVWNHSAEELRTGVLARLVPSLELLEVLVAQQQEQLAPDFETLAAVALHNVDLQAGGRDGEASEEKETKLLTEQAERFFADLWVVPGEK